MEEEEQQAGELSAPASMAELVAALTTAELAARAGLPRIEIMTVNERGYDNKISRNAAQFPPPSGRRWRRRRGRSSPSS